MWNNKVALEMRDFKRSKAQPYLYVFFLVPLLATAYLYRDTMVRLGKSLMTYENSHGLVIMAISLYLVWGKRQELKKQPFKPNMIFGSLLTVLGCAFLVAGNYTFSVILSDVSLVITLFGLTWLLLGTDRMRILALPIGYLIFAYPLFDYLPANILVRLQQITAWVAAGLLKSTGMTVYRDSIFLELPNATLQVAQVCAGTSHIIALIAVSILLAHFTLDGWIKKIALVTAALFIGLAANGVRVAVIGFLSVFGRDASLHGPGDILYVSFVFLAGLAVIIGLNYLLGGRRISSAGDDNREHHPDEPDRAAIKGHGCRTWENARGTIFYLPFVIATLIPLSAFAYMHTHSPQPLPLENTLSTLPLTIGEWQATCAEKTDFIPSDMRPDEMLVRCYRNGKGQEVHLYVAYFTQQQQKRKVTDFTLNSYVEGEEYPVFAGREQVMLRRAIPNRRGATGNTYFWYSIDGKAISDRLQAKMTLIKNGIMHQRTNGCLTLIRVENGHESPKIKTMEDREIIEAFFPIVQEHLGS